MKCGVTRDLDESYTRVVRRVPSGFSTISGIFDMYNIGTGRRDIAAHKYAVFRTSQFRSGFFHSVGTSLRTILILQTSILGISAGERRVGGHLLMELC